MKIVIKILLCTLFILPVIGFANGFEMDLNGFRLWQYKDGVRDYFGKPYKTIERKDSTFEAHGVNDTSYMVFEYLNEKFKDNVYSVQITGYPTKMLPFKGLTLGDPVAKVEGILGKPLETKKVAGTTYTINYYQQANFNTEYDENGRLYSIKLYVSDEFMNEAEHDFKTWAKFKKAVISKDVKTILETLRPDAEIFKDGDVLSINKRYKDFENMPDKAFLNALIGNKNSVRAELLKSNPEGEMRLLMGMGIGQVFKFYEGKVLREIVLFPYGGEYRIYEIAFRNTKEK